MSKVLGIIIALISLVSAAIAVDARYTKDTTFIAFADQYKADKSQYHIDALMERKWKLEDRIENLKYDRTSKDAVKTLQEEVRTIDKDIEVEKKQLERYYKEK